MLLQCSIKKDLFLFIVCVTHVCIGLRRPKECVGSPGMELQACEWPHMSARKINVILCSLNYGTISLAATMFKSEFTGTSSAQAGRS